MRQAPPEDQGPRVNEAIKIDPVRLIDADGAMVGVVSLEESLARADEAGLDLVEVSPNADPPVCKLLDYGKYRYRDQRKAREAKKKQRTFEVKEVKIRPNIDDHDYGVKMRSVTRFLSEGNKVKVTLRFRGREMAHQELGRQLLERIHADLADRVKIEQEPALEGRQMVTVIAPAQGLGQRSDDIPAAADGKVPAAPVSAPGTEKPPAAADGKAPAPVAPAPETEKAPAAADRKTPAAPASAPGTEETAVGGVKAPAESESTPGTEEAPVAAADGKAPAASAPGAEEAAAPRAAGEVAGESADSS